VEEKVAARTRNMQINIRVSPEEKEFIMKKFAKCGHTNFNLFAIKMLVTGSVKNVDLSPYHALAREVNRIGTNINQIAKFANSNGGVYAAEIGELQQKVGEIWQLLKSSLSEQR
jgi:HAMP domain-containing protein